MNGIFFSLEKDYFMEKFKLILSPQNSIFYLLHEVFKNTVK